MEPEVSSLSFPQEPATCPYSEFNFISMKNSSNGMIVYQDAANIVFPRANTFFSLDPRTNKRLLALFLKTSSQSLLYLTILIHK
jgi:hypothetical protein